MNDNVCNDKDIFSIKPETLRDMLIKKHEKFLETYKKELKEVKEKKGQKIVLKKMVEILPDKTDLLEYWSRCLEENLSKIDDDIIVQEIREKIAKFKKEKQDAEIELRMKMSELEEIEKDKNDMQDREEWLIRKIESHIKSLNFWKGYLK